MENQAVWSALSRQIAETIEGVEDSIVTVHGGGRSTSSGVVWRPGVIVTVRQGLRRTDSLQVGHQEKSFPAELAGSDAGTDLAVLRVKTGADKPAQTLSIMNVSYIYIHNITYTCQPLLDSCIFWQNSQ